MRLLLHNVGRYSHQEIQLPDATPENCLINVSGSNGAGKTTVFRALMWCISDSEIDFEVVRHGTPRSEKVYALLEYGNLQIYKQKNPNFTRVTIASNSGNIIYDHFDAINYLQSIFGRPQVLSASCYLAANVHHPLLTAPAKEKLRILRDLAFSDVNPEVHIHTATGIVQQYRQQFTTQSLSVERDKSVLAKQMATVNWQLYLPPDQRSTVLQRLSQLPQLISQAMTSRAQRQHLEQEISQLPELSQEKPDADRLQKITIDLYLWERYDPSLHQKLEQLKKYGQPTDADTLDKVLSCTESWRNYQTYLQAKKKLGDVDPESSRSALQGLLEYRKYAADIASLAGIAALDLSELRSQEKQLRQKLLLRPQKCPSCKAELCLESGTLRLLQTSYDAEKLEAELQEIIKKIEQQERLAKMPPYFSQLKPFADQLPKSWHDLSDAEISQIMSLKRVDQPQETVEQIKGRIELRELSSRVIEPPKSSKSELTAELLKLTEQTRLYEKWCRRQELESRLKELPVVDLLGLQQEYHKLSEQASSWAVADHVMSFKAEVDLREQQKEESKALFEDWLVIQQTLVKADNQIMEEVISGINQALAHFMRQLFDRVEMKLAMSDSSRNAITVSIVKTKSVPPIVLDNIKSLSGSEQKRASLALTLACRSICHSPWLLLDEIFSTVDQDFCEKGRQVIRQHLRQIPGLCMIINHHDLEGQYDNQIKIVDPEARVPENL